jgi:O-succinylbenzoic acid--CoA ligase
VTIVSLVPTQLAALLDLEWRPPSHLRAVLLGGAAAPPALVESALARGIPVLATYGMTESFGQIATAVVPGGPLVPLPGVHLTAGTRDAPAPIVVEAPMLARRYLDGRDIAPRFTTADLGSLDTHLVVVGRADDVIITGGENVHPAQVEAVVATTPGVRAAVAFGVADDRWGQIVGAALVAEPWFEAAAAEAYWRARLPSFARPRRWMLVDALPLLANGKVDRRAAARLLA